MGELMPGTMLTELHVMAPTESREEALEVEIHGLEGRLQTLSDENAWLNQEVDRLSEGVPV